MTTTKADSKYSTKKVLFEKKNLFTFIGIKIVHVKKRMRDIFFTSKNKKNRIINPFSFSFEFCFVLSF